MKTMDFAEAKCELQKLLGRVDVSHLPRLVAWMRTSDELDELLADNRKAILQDIAGELRARLPPDAMLSSEVAANLKMRRLARPTAHVDAFLYDDQQVDAMCAAGAMSRSYCLACGSLRSGLLDFVSHSFSVAELRFLFQNLLPDLTGRRLLDVGSRLGTVLYGGYLYSSAAKLVGVEISEEFVQLQNFIVEKYKFSDRVQVVHADVCSQDTLLQDTDVLIMNNVFEFFVEPAEQLKAWRFIMQNFRKTGALLVTVPSLQEALSAVQEAPPPGWLQELPVDYNVHEDADVDAEDLRQIHLYQVL